MVEFINFKTSKRYITAVISKNPGKIVMSTSGVASGKSEEDVTGDSIPIGVAQFQVYRSLDISSADGDVYSDVISAVANDFVNTFSIKFANDLPAIVRESRSGSQNTTELTIFKDDFVGVFAYSDSVEVVNMIPISNVAPAIPTITVRGVKARDGELFSARRQSTLERSFISLLTVLSF